MLDPARPAPIWLFWPYLSFLEKLYFISLCVLVIYALLIATGTVTSLRNIGRIHDTSPRQRSIAGVHMRLGALRQLTVAAFFLFGVVLFTSFLFAYMIVDNSGTPIGWLVLKNLQIHFAFAANVFFVFLILHFIQWFAANRVHAYAMQSNGRA